MWKNVVNIGHHYFHNVDMSEANIHIMKIMLTDIHAHYFHNVVKIFLVYFIFHNEKSDGQYSNRDTSVIEGVCVIADD